MGNYDNFSLYYDALTENVDYDARNRYFYELLCRGGVKNGILLDLACGTGSFSVRMAELGYDVIGVDMSSQMLCVAQQKAFECGQNILFLCQRMQELDLYGTVNCAICTLDSINHLTDEADVLRTFERVSLFLERGGVFLLDINTVYKHKTVLANNTFVYDTNDVYCVWQNRFDDSTCTAEINLDFFEEDDGVYYRSEESFCERAYPTEKICGMLESSGFKVKDIFNEMTFEAPHDDAQRIVIAAEKI